MKKNWRNRKIEIRNQKAGWLSMFLLLFMVSLVSCSNPQQAHEPDIYTCPMHPTVISDRKGTCPVCSMNLVRKARPGEEVEITEDLARLIKSPNEVVVASIKTIKGEFKSMSVSRKAYGIVTYDTRNLYTIPARVGGRLEKVFLTYAFQRVRKGQKVAEIYSPELLTAQRELLYLVEQDATNTALIELAKNKLYLLGATSQQVEDVIRRKEVASTFSIYSAYDGYVIGETQQAPALATSPSSSSSGMGGGMEGSSTSGSSTPAPVVMNAAGSNLIREGNYVSVGQTLFKIVNAAALRVELDLPTDAGSVQLQDEIDLDLGNEKGLKGKVDFIQPFFSQGEEFLKVRLYVKNDQALQVGQLMRAMIRLKPVEALWVPREAILDLGLSQLVFVKERGTFKPKKVSVGVESDGWITILRGLSSSDEIASDAHYLVDSESFVKAER